MAEVINLKLSHVDFQHKLKAYLTLYDLSVAELARKSGIRETTMRAWALGRSEPTLYNLRLLCEATDTSADWWVW